MVEQTGIRLAAALALTTVLLAVWCLPVKAAEWQPYITEDFSSLETMFYTGQAGEAFYAVDDQERYVIDGSNTASDSLSALTDSLYYYYLEAECGFMDTDDPENSFVGLLFHYNKKTQGKLAYYVFYIYPDGFYGAKRVIGDRVDIILPLAYSTNIDTTLPNVLAVDAQGTRFDLYINGRFVDSFTDVRIDGGGFGVYSSKFTKAAFDDFKVKIERRGSSKVDSAPPAVQTTDDGARTTFEGYRPLDIPRDPDRPVYPWEVGVDKTGKGKKDTEPAEEPGPEPEPEVIEVAPVEVQPEPEPARPESEYIEPEPVRPAPEYVEPEPVRPVEDIAEGNSHGAGETMVPADEIQLGAGEEMIVPPPPGVQAEGKVDEGSAGPVETVEVVLTPAEFEPEPETEPVIEQPAYTVNNTETELSLLPAEPEPGVATMEEEATEEVLPLVPEPTETYLPLTPAPEDSGAAEDEPDVTGDRQPVELLIDGFKDDVEGEPVADAGPLNSTVEDELEPEIEYPELEDQPEPKQPRKRISLDISSGDDWGIDTTWTAEPSTEPERPEKESTEQPAGMESPDKAAAEPVTEPHDELSLVPVEEPALDIQPDEPAVKPLPAGPTDPFVGRDDVIVVEDDFSEPRWSVSENQTSTYRYFGAAYEIDNLNADTMAISFQDADYGDMALGIDIEYLDGVSYVGYGAAARFTVDNGQVSYYGLFVSESGEFLLLKVTKGREFVLADWTASPHLSPTLPNRIELQVLGSTIIALINGQKVAQIVDTELTHGGYALLAGPGTSARYDNLGIIALPN